MRPGLQADRDLLDWLQSGHATLGRQTTFREGGGGSGTNDHERSITDRRFSLGHSPDGDVGRMRKLARRWAALGARDRDVLEAAFADSAQVLRQAIAAVHGPGAWVALERVFGQFAAVGLYLAPGLATVRPAPRRRPSWDDLAHGGEWSTVRAHDFVRLTVQGKLAGLAETTEKTVRAALERWAPRVDLRLVASGGRRVDQAWHAATPVDRLGVLT